MPKSYNFTNFTCTVSDLASSSYGKYAEEYAETTIIMELEPIFATIADSLPEEIASQKAGPDFKTFVGNIKS